MHKFNRQFYQQKDTLELAETLIGKSIFTNFNNLKTGGIITETEAYCGITDKACHAYNNKRTKRTETMFKAGGVIYVYLCYGIHHLLNIVTNTVDEPHAILIRAIHPTTGIETMKIRRKKSVVNKSFTKGPGTVSQALGISIKNNGLNLTENQIWIENSECENIIIEKTPRIGIEYAKEDALLPYRFVTSHFDVK